MRPAAAGYPSWKFCLRPQGRSRSSETSTFPLLVANFFGRFFDRVAGGNARDGRGAVMMLP
jgi:hypothetical protein